MKTWQQNLGAPIPMLDLQGEVEELWAELNAAIQRVLRSGHFILGREAAAFEDEVASFLGVGHAVGVNSGTDALVIGLRSLGVGPGDEVITSPFTFVATVEAILSVGATPVFADVEYDSFNVSPDSIHHAITDATRAILPVHLFGRPANLGAIMAIAERHGLMVLEDAAQAFGARIHSEPDFEGTRTLGTGQTRVGGRGDAGAFSLYPTKNLGAYGDAGLIVTDDGQIADKARLLRNHGQRARYDSQEVGYNSRLDELQAAILRVKLPRVDAWNASRRAAADRYRALLADVEGIVVPGPHAEHVFHQFTVRILGGRRDDVASALGERGIATSVFYPRTLDRLPYLHQPQRCSVAAELADQVLSLPLWPGMAPAIQQRVASELAHVLEARKGVD